ncbi:MAG: type II toxin-antitoxin system RelE/ParE family toxin [Balneolaceae bacterium]|nr:type II toxin-antitoxin system RelE/ParE family toxin [Balneolaceae bacterium]
MANYQLIIDRRAIAEIQSAIDYYNEVQSGLGLEFENELNEKLTFLSEQPFFQIRYKDVRCLPLIRFPFMVHYQVDNPQERVIVRAVLNTRRDPKSWL